MFSLRTDAILKWVKGPEVLDVGCTGHFVNIGSPQWLHGRLREKFPSVSGIDISEANAAILRENGFDKIYVQSAESFQLSDKFDTIVAGELIEHLANPGLFLQQARAHLKPGGRLVLTTPNAFSLLFISYALLKYPKTCQNLQHTCWFCPQTMKELVERNGFKIEHFELFDDYPPDSPSWRYRLFVAVRGWFGFLLPKLLAKNGMFLVLAPDPDSAADTDSHARVGASQALEPTPERVASGD
jgi:SAM-dependent methyltransferase